MSLGDQKVLALGNTASVMPSIAKTMSNLYVACPTNVSSVVLQGNEKCFPANQLDYPLSISCYTFVRRMSQTFNFFHAELGYAVACNLAEVPFGVHIHGVTDIELLFPRTALGRFLKRPYREALLNASYVVCHPAVLASVRNLRKDAMGLPLPVDADQFNDKIRPFSFGEGISIFSPSRMDRWKGHEIIWEALRLMRNRNRVTVYQTDWGWEPEYSQFKRQAPENVRFIPLVPRERIASYYRGATLVIGQMKIGYFGMVEVEAMACGAPVLVYLLDEGTPLLPKHDDPLSLAEAIDRLIEDDELRAEYARACTDSVIPAVNLAVIRDKFLALLVSSDRTRRRRSGSLSGLFLGTGFEMGGRVLGDKMFALLKSSLIGL